MTWVKLDDGFPEHPKAVGLSDAALACWVRGLCYASRNLTDGGVPTPALRLVGTRKAATELVAAGLWDETPDGWFVHDYGEHQRTRDEVETQREQNRERARVSRQRRSERARTSQRDKGVSHSEVTKPESESETETELITIAPAPPARRTDSLWDSVMVACSIHSERIPDGARAAYNKALKELRTVGATPDEVAQRAKVYKVRWPDVSLTPTALARRWAECEPNVAHLPGRTAPKSAGALARVVAERTR